MAGTSEGGRKAAKTRGYDSLSEAGRKGGQSAQTGQKGNQKRSQDAGRKGGQRSQGGKANTNKDEDQQE